jgi:hypothetical protein
MLQWPGGQGRSLLRRQAHLGGGSRFLRLTAERTRTTLLWIAAEML